ncbi:putative peroxidase-related enzyme [Neisseria sp. HSC-16F19]|nr:carboxymuconolactone decarboxylase family protein [Neisseria sp. HSC-16F19]MCP2040227.1 putative peroxidase-related enzyme [Neisseria sp. HSC-16F19]
MSRITLQTAETVNPEAKARLETAQKNNGFLPNLIAVLANAPTALETYQEVGAINGRTSLTGGEREVVQLTAASVNGCGFCQAGHTALSVKKKLLDDDAIKASRQLGELADARLNALAEFTRAVMANKGNVSDEELAAFFAAGYNEQQALEVVLGVSLATLCNYANNLARSEINPELQAYA